MIAEGKKWWALKKEWGKVSGMGEAQITSVRLLDKRNRERTTFKVGEDIIVRSDFIARNATKEPHFGAAIFREDGLYCYGPNTLRDGYAIDRIGQGKGWFSVRYKKVNLAAGQYRVSVGLWDKREVLPYSYHPGCYKFEITGQRVQGELLNLDYHWNNGYYFSGLWDRAYPLGIFNIDSIEDRWRKKEDSSGTKIIAVEFSGGKSRSGPSYNTNQPIQIKVMLDIRDAGRNIYLWVGIFRKDGIYCHGAVKKIYGKEKQISLAYPRLPLLPTQYLVSAGIWQNTDKVFLSLHHACYPFDTFFNKADHGIVYLEHEWKWKLP